MIGSDLDQIEAFCGICRQHGVLVRYWWRRSKDPRGLFEVIRHIERFTVTDEHLRLLRRAHVSWDSAEFGAPGLDPKRPYGNSNVFGDIAEILGVPDREWMDVDDELNADAEWRFLRVHAETAMALQVALATGEFRVGQHVRGNDYNDWKRHES